MSKVFSVRLPDELAEWVEAYATERGVKSSAVIVSGVEGLREDAQAGVPDLEPVIGYPPVEKPAVEKKSAGEWERIMRERQARLNKQMGWGKA